MRRAGIDIGVRIVVALGIAAVTVAGCRPVLDDRPWLIRRPTIVGWIADPPEAAPGGEVTLQVVALDPAGAPDTTGTTWTLCRAPKPPAENRVVTADCLATAPAPADALGDPATLAIPRDACRLFGPDPPQPAPGAPPTRPRDPDASGGYYQPVTIALGDSLAVGLARITCDLPDASLAVARAFQAAYRANQNPVITALTFTVDGAPVDRDAVPAGARVHIEATWSADAAETFAVYDRATGMVVERREELLASWYVTGGALSQPVSKTEGDTDSPSPGAAATDWIAPEMPSAVAIALVLTDSRGGSGAVQTISHVAAVSP